MDKSFQNTGIDFYESLEIIENELLALGAIKSKNREGYLDAFQSLLSNNKIWESHYDSYLSLEKKSLKGFNLKFNRFKFLGICSNIDPRFEEVKFNSSYVQRYLLNQFIDKPFDDNNLLDGLILFTDFKDDYLRYNLTYLLLLNMEKKHALR